MNGGGSMKSITIKPIGVFHTSQKQKFEAERQAILDDSLLEETDALTTPGWIELESQNNFEQALIGLDKVERIWVVFQFHFNQNWNPMVLPPRSENKQGVFATRSPHRPNPIGLSCLVIEKIEGLKIFVKNSDLLDQTPIFDIKPYIPYADAFPGSYVGWLENQKSPKFNVRFSPQAQSQIDWLKSFAGLTELKKFIQTQLSYNPTDSKRKRVKEEKGLWTLSYRTWRIDFIIAENEVAVMSLHSGYTDSDLQTNESGDFIEDKYQDKKNHMKFKNEYN